MSSKKKYYKEVLKSLYCHETLVVVSWLKKKKGTEDITNSTGTSPKLLLQSILLSLLLVAVHPVTETLLKWYK